MPAIRLETHSINWRIRGYWIHRRPRLRVRDPSFSSEPAALIFLNPIHQLYGNTLRPLLNACNPRNILFTLILVLEKARRVKAGGRVFLQSPRVMRRLFQSKMPIPSANPPRRSPPLSAKTREALMMNRELFGCGKPHQ